MRIVCTALFVLLTLSVFAQGEPRMNTGTIRQTQYFEKVPYTSSMDKLFLEVVKDGEKYNFLFDTGAPLVLSERLFNKLQPKVLGRVNVGSESGGTDSLTIFSLKELSLGGLTFENTTGLVMKHSKFFNECLKIDGFIGSNMLRNSVVQIDSKEKQLIITDNAKNLTLSKKYSTQMIVETNQSSPLIEVLLKNGKYTVKDIALFDSGYNGFYDINYNGYIGIKDKTAIREKAKAVGATTYGLHGAAEANEIVSLEIPQLMISKATFSNVSFMTTRGRSKIGANILNYGKAIIDYKNRKFYFEPFSEVVDLKAKQPGLSPVPNGDKLVVGVIWDAELRNKINLGDEILKVGDVDFQSKGLCELLNFNSKMVPDTVVFELKDVNTGEVKKIEVSKR